MRPHPADLLSLLVLASAGLATGAWFALDARPAADLGHYYEQLPLAWDWLQGHLDSPQGLPGRVGGAYQLMLAAAMVVFGRGEAVLAWVELGWMLLLLASVGLAGRALGGPRAGFAALALAAAMPVFHTGARSHWLHFVELAAVAPAVAAWLHDPELERRGTAPLMALGILFVLLLRETGLILALPLAVCAAWTGRARALRLLPVLMALVVGGAVLLPGLASYLGGKAGIREVYEGAVTPVPAALVQGAFVLPGALAVLGILLAVWRGPRRLGMLLLAIRVLGGVSAAALFNAGVDNFPVVFLGSAVLGGVGLATLGHRGALGVGGALLLGTAGLSLGLPFANPVVAEAFVPAFGRSLASFGANVYLRPQSQVLIVEGILPMIQQICPPGSLVLDGSGLAAEERCTIVATRGLFDLNRDDDQRLALFVAGIDGLRFHNAAQWWFPGDLAQADQVDGLVLLDCPMEPGPPTPFAEREEALAQLVRTLRLRPVGFIGHPPAHCPVRWLKVEEPQVGSVIRDFAREYPWTLHELPSVGPHARGRPAER